MKYSGYTFAECITHLKRLNRIYPKFYDFDSEEYDTVLAENPSSISSALLQKYSPLTTLVTLEFLLSFLAGRTTEDIMERYNEEISDLMDMKNNPTNYLKISSFAELREIIKEYYPDYMRNSVSFTNFRNFMFLAILVYEVPIKLHHLINIKFCRNTPLHECLSEPIYLLQNRSTFYFIMNKRKNKKLVRQLEYKIKNPLVSKILLQYIANYKKYNCPWFFSAASGRPLSKSNISNGLMNFCSKILDVPITIHDIRLVYSKLPEIEEGINKEVFTF